ncbi:hypothetical protein ACNFR7_20785 [Streptomyces sp. RM1]
MEWMDTARALAEDPLVRLAVGEGVRGIATDEAQIAWAAKRTHDRPESLLTLLVLLKSCARLGYFPAPGEVPVLVAARVRAAVGLPEGVMPRAEERTAKRTIHRHQAGVIRAQRTRKGGF